jgi:hypothetical protein
MTTVDTDPTETAGDADPTETRVDAGSPESLDAGGPASSGRAKSDARLLRVLPLVAIGRAVMPPARRNGRENLAVGQPATQSSISQRWSARATRWEDARRANKGVANGKQGCHTDRQPFPWWQVDLGGVCRLSEVLIYNRKEDAERLRHFSILTSLDAARWLELYRKTDDDVFGARYLVPFVAKLPEGSVGRFVRIQANVTDFMHFSECAVYGQLAAEAELPALEACLEAGMTSEARRMCEPFTGTTHRDINLELLLSRRLLPFQATALQRNQARDWILDYVAEGGIAAEVGVFRGLFSEIILRKAKPTKFYLVDPWTKLGEFFEIGGGYSNFGLLPTALARREAELRTRKFPDTESVIVEEFFPEGASSIAEPLDWIYLDASHTYERTKIELEGCARLLKPGGLILGDDFWALPGAPFPGVVRAVREFVKREPFEFVAAGPHGQWCVRHLPGRAGQG